jgi:hypothetical protein
MNLFHNSLSKLVLLGFPLAVSIANLAQKANAVYGPYICPNGPGSGERQVGMTPGGNGVASVPLCETNATNQESGSYNSSPSSNPYISPETIARDMEQANELILFGQKRELLRQQQELFEDPEYRKYLSGRWKLFPTVTLEEGTPGEYCTASFLRVSMDPEANNAPVMINLSGPGGDYKGALLTFSAEAIPKPTKMETITVTLIQNDDPPVTVKAFNYVMPTMPSFGVIAFAVPTIDDALTGMEDVQSFDVKIDDKSVANTTWYSGLKVKDEFRRCLNGQPYSVTDIDMVPKDLKME